MKSQVTLLALLSFIFATAGFAQVPTAVSAEYGLVQGLAEKCKTPSSFAP